MSGDEKQTARIEAFSDGVFAIAITLLILELKIPPFATGHDPSNRELLQALGDDWHHYLAFFLSFVSILVMWVNHHRIFTVVRKADDAFVYWNGLLLMFVTIVPFPTALIAEFMDKGAAKTAAAVYSGMALLIALAFTGLWQHAVKDGRLLTKGFREREAEELTEQYRYGPLAYLAAFGLSFVSAQLSIGLCLALVVFFAFRGWMGRR
jgi:uncharacterized membrane protein